MRVRTCARTLTPLQRAFAGAITRAAKPETSYYYSRVLFSNIFFFFFNFTLRACLFIEHVYNTLRYYYHFDNGNKNNNNNNNSTTESFEISPLSPCVSGTHGPRPTTLAHIHGRHIGIIRALIIAARPLPASDLLRLLFVDVVRALFTRVISSARVLIEKKTRYNKTRPSLERVIFSIHCKTKRGKGEKEKKNARAEYSESSARMPLTQ